MRRLLLALTGWTAVAWLLLPVLYAVWVSFSPDSFFTPPAREWSLRWYRAFLSDRRWMLATVRSVYVAIFSSLATVSVATCATAACRQSSPAMQRMLTAVVLLPVCVSPAALAAGLLPVAYAARIWGTLTSMVLAHSMLGLPVAFLILRSCWTEQITELETAARGLGAGGWTVFRRVTLPLLIPGFTAAGIAVFVLSLNETLISLFLATPASETLPAVVWPQLRFAASPLVAVASCVTAAGGAAGLMAGGVILRRRKRTS